MPGCCCFSFCVAISPFMPGIEMSMTTTSGRDVAASFSTVAPSLASPITFMSGCPSISSLRPCRTVT
jgi:hypothetical protein